MTTNPNTTDLSDVQIGRRIGAAVAATEALSRLAGGRNFRQRANQYLHRGELSVIDLERGRCTAAAMRRDRVATMLLLERLDEHLAQVADACDEIEVTMQLRGAIALGAASEAVALKALDLPEACWEEDPYF